MLILKILVTKCKRFSLLWAKLSMLPAWPWPHPSGCGDQLAPCYAEQGVTRGRELHRPGVKGKIKKMDGPEIPH